MRDILERHQITIYLAAVALAAVVGLVLPDAQALTLAVNPALAIMLFVTFLQVPLARIGDGLRQPRFLGALMVANFLVVPLLVAILMVVAPADPLIRLGILMVLLTPCIDYVITFTHLGGGDARRLLGATPLLLVVQMVALPVYLGLFLGDAAGLVRAGPFLHAFLWLIAAPLICAGVVQAWANRRPTGRHVADILGVLSVPATAAVLAIVVASTVPVLGAAGPQVLWALPVYLAFGGIAPLIGWAVARAFGLAAPVGRAVAFSAATRNSLVVLPLALAVPGAAPILPAIIVAQTLVELAFQLVYIRLIPRLGARAA
ncbi:MAG: arsenic resistance protein [Paracoccus denitrificans]|nr:MAG: arsenic resistance protein [Paracoccus denitrificans]PZO85544.1 MAG: arsenic resistance protein [Paracoccus denitrificans]